jgi:NADPH:quinone reductase-like Zn-dependent oxidoreductase
MDTITIPKTMQAVRLSSYGGPEVLELVDVPVPTIAPDRVLVRVRATAINPGETNIRVGRLAEIYPMEFPFGEGSDLAGDVVAVGDQVSEFAAGDAVFGWSDERAAHAEFVSVPADQLAHKPEALSYERAGSLYVIGATAVASVDALKLTPFDTVVISGAAGGVGVLATQLAVRPGARVLALASPANHAWLRDHGAEPLPYDGDVVSRLREAAPNGVDAFLDLFGDGYVALAQDDLGVAADRINTIIDFAAVGERGVLSVGNAEGAKISNLVALADDIVAGRLDLPIAATYPLSEVRAAFEELAARHTHGKIVLLP